MLKSDLFFLVTSKIYPEGGSQLPALHSGVCVPDKCSLRYLFTGVLILADMLVLGVCAAYKLMCSQSFNLTDTFLQMCFQGIKIILAFFFLTPSSFCASQKCHLWRTYVGDVDRELLAV